MIIIIEHDETSGGINHCFGDDNQNQQVLGGRFKSLLKVTNDDYNVDNEDEGSTVAIAESDINLILSDDLLERIIAFLPIASIFRAGSVCKRWNSIVSSRSFLWYYSTMQIPAMPKPWYLMFTSSYEPPRYAYDTEFQKWYRMPDLFPHSVQAVARFWGRPTLSSSYGLVFFMETTRGIELFVCNPITKACKRIKDPPCGTEFMYYLSLAFHVDRKSHVYTIAIVNWHYDPSTPAGINDLGSFVIQVYDSETKTWVSFVSVITEWVMRHDEQSVICNGILYYLFHSSNNNEDVRLIAYNLNLCCSQSSSSSSSRSSFIPTPSCVTYKHLLNLKDRLVMVGGFAKHNGCHVIKGIGIWVLDHTNNEEWEEISTMPHKIFQKGFFREGGYWCSEEDLTKISGANDLIYFQSSKSTFFVMFDMNKKQWKLGTPKYPLTNYRDRFFTGFFL